VAHIGGQNARGRVGTNQARTKKSAHMAPYTLTSKGEKMHAQVRNVKKVLSIIRLYPPRAQMVKSKGAITVECVTIIHRTHVLGDQIPPVNEQETESAYQGVVRSHYTDVDNG